MKKVLAEVPWEYGLYDVDGKLFLEVSCGSVAIFELVIELNAEERAAWEAKGVPGIMPLVEKVRNAPDRFTPRRTKLPD